MKHCFVIPVYNHPHYLTALLSHLSPFELPIIMVNDGSDATCTAVLHQLAHEYPMVDLVEHTHNQGKGQAVITGLKRAFQCGYSHALQLDADGQHDWQDVQRFLDKSIQHSEAMIIGQPIFDATVPKKRLYGRYATHIWVWINSLSFDIKDSMCGFRVYPLAQTVSILNTAKFQPRMGFDSEILVRLKWDNVPFINLPTHVIYPEGGISHFDVWRDNLGMARAHSRLLGGMLLRFPQADLSESEKLRRSEKHMQKWSAVKERGGMLPLMLMLGFYRLGGRWLCRVILYFVILWYWLFSNTARQASLLYLKKLHHFAGAQSPFQAEPQLWNSYTHLMQFGECILDKIEGWLGHIPEQNLKLHGHAHFRSHYQKGAVIVVSHFGNIELLRAIKAEHPQKINVLVYQKHATKFNAFLKKLNEHADVNLVSVDELGIETALILQDKLDQGEWVIVAADRVPVQSDRVQSVAFLGEQALWPQGAWILASLLKAPVLAVFCYRVDTHFEVHIHQVAEQLNWPRKERLQAMQQTTRQYVELLEQHCIRAPYQWFNFL